jgi:hypothetical protein
MERGNMTRDEVVAELVFRISHLRLDS